MDDQVGFAAAEGSLWELVARWFTKAAAVVLRRDLLKDYKPVSESLKTVRGTLSAIPTARSYYSGRLELHCRFDEFDVDSPLNRLIRGASEAIVTSPVFSKGVRREAAHIRLRLSDVGELRATDMDAAVDRRSWFYADAAILARHILLSVGLSVFRRKGPKVFKTFPPFRLTAR
jgi:5-methylcytosine-specific restriction endonuclease McrBC regulatory subunit McrC